MGSPYVGEIRMFGGTFAPFNWAFCNGALIAVTQNETLYNLIGTTYGGDGINTFGLPDLQGRVPVHQGQGPGLSNYVLGQKAGTETVTLTTQQMPAHPHGALGAATGSAIANPMGATWGNSGINNKSFGPTATAAMNAGSLGMTGNGQPHDNLMPFLVISFIISLYGIYPTQS
jgi:microcystin-dependent protein